MTGTVETMVREAEKSLGITGRPNSITRPYAMRNGAYYANAPWCCESITEWARRSDNYQPVMFGKDEAYTVYLAQRYRDHDQWHVGVTGIRRGDVVFFDWNGSKSIGNIDHVGLVTGYNGRDVLTIEGNTADRCARRVRLADTIVGYGRPRYAGAPRTPAQSAGGVHADYPGASWFSMGRRSDLVAHMHDRLVAEGCNRYESSQHKDVIGSGDVASYEAWQRKCGFTGSAAKWPPGKGSWDRLKVPR